MLTQSRFYDAKELSWARRENSDKLERIGVKRKNKGKSW